MIYPWWFWAKFIIDIILFIGLVLIVIAVFYVLKTFIKPLNSDKPSKKGG